MHKISIPKGAKAIILGLRYENHEAYIVGGCVRDSLLGKEPKDWDICTSATPQEVKEYLNRCSVRTIDTGLKHGTITADMERAGKYEITTFRIDGDYSDNRRPDSVTFTESIYQDLSRRDFTINAMAYNDDPFHGVDDLKNGIIRCVGNPNDRFSEDALRILRALRFASVYGFSIEKNTAQAIHDNAWRLTNIAAERIHSELCKLLLGNGVLPVLLDYPDVIATIIPEMKPCIGFDQNNKYHQYTIYDHIAHAVANYTGKDIAVKVALLLHDIGKPCCYTEDENGGHFHGHGNYSYDISKVVLERLRFDTTTKQEVLDLADYIGSTSGIINYATESDNEEFIICTESGVGYELRTKNPNKKFYFAGTKHFCPNMKLNTVEKVCHVLKTGENEVHVSDETRLKSLVPLDKMLEMAK